MAFCMFTRGYNGHVGPPIRKKILTQCFSPWGFDASETQRLQTNKDKEVAGGLNTSVKENNPILIINV